MPTDSSKLEKLLTESEAAELVGTTPGTLRYDRAKGRGLPYVKIGARVRYRPEEIRTYLEERTIRPGA